MSFNARDYDGETNEGNALELIERQEIAEREDAEREAIEEALIDARCANFVAGRCSGQAADEGGERYEREMRESDPVWRSVNGWLTVMGAVDLIPARAEHASALLVKEAA